MIDLRSDTCSRLTPELRTAMTNAELADDVYGDDPTVKASERATAELLGTEDAVYMPTGTITNQVGIRAHTEPGDAVLLDQNAQALIGERPLVTKAKPWELSRQRLAIIHDRSGTGSAV
ncbi:MAG TPA: beta-eliminating lyase-related protein [Casimicrobiaceae bacterium]|jgi:threonine aldolase|nr:beta-eliminating lyase-related protein [Casimicrobiaceae bacterium]